jgi:hypothetical protein
VDFGDEGVGAGGTVEDSFAHQGLLLEQRRERPHTRVSEPAKPLASVMTCRTPTLITELLDAAGPRMRDPDSCL